LYACSPVARHTRRPVPARPSSRETGRVGSRASGHWGSGFGSLVSRPIPA
jgi:hypothetical protein